MSTSSTSRSGTEPPCAILLAAGRSERFGAPKLLAPLADGTPVALASARALKAAVRVVAAVRPGDGPLARLLRGEGLEVVEVPTAGRGMGHSLAAAVAASRGAGGWIVALADMPAVAPATVARLLSLLDSGAPIAAPLWRGQRGHPVAFSAPFGPELEALEGDRGARVVIERHRHRVVTFESGDPGVVADIDTAADLAAIDALLEQRGRGRER